MIRNLSAIGCILIVAFPIVVRAQDTSVLSHPNAQHWPLFDAPLVHSANTNEGFGGFTRLAADGFFVDESVRTFSHGDSPIDDITASELQIAPPVPPLDEGFRRFLRVGFGGFRVVKNRVDRTSMIDFNDPFDLLLGYVDANGDGTPDDLNGDGLITSGLFLPGEFLGGTGDKIRLGVVFDEVRSSERQSLSAFSITRRRRWGGSNGHAASSAWLFALHGSVLNAEFLMAPPAAFHGTGNDEFPFVGPLKHSSYIGYGIQLVNTNSEFEARGLGGILNDSWWTTEIDRWIAGPQWEIGNVAVYRRWALDCKASFMFGYGWTQFDQRGELGTASNSFSSGFDHESDDHGLGYLAEARVTSSYFFNSTISLDLSATIFAVGPWNDASEAIRYDLPALGIDEDSSSGGLVGGYLTLGVTNVF